MIYLDNSATTPLSEYVKQETVKALDLFGNPSSLHSLGVASKKALDSARADVCHALGVKAPRPDELIFTGSGTEANCLAILGSAKAKKRRDATVIITTDSEHPSVDNAVEQTRELGFEPVKLPTSGGALDLDTLDAVLNSGKKVFMITLMLVNNETGALYDVKNAFAKVKKKFPDAITHCDAIQGFMKVPFTPQTLGADLITVSSHKIHGPKGVGALYVSPAIIKAKKLVPIVFGGGQEHGMRSGTENLLGILSFAAAARESYATFKEDASKMTALRNLLEEGLSGIDGVRLNIPSGTRAPHILICTMPSIKSETMLHFLSAEGICVSSGSACSSHAKEPSRPLVSFGLTAHEADCTLRLSLSRYNTESDVTAVINAIKNGCDRLVRIR